MIEEEYIGEVSSDVLLDFDSRTRLRIQTTARPDSKSRSQAQRESARSFGSRTESWATAKSRPFSRWSRISKMSSTASFVTARTVASSRHQSLLIERNSHGNSPWQSTLSDMNLLVHASVEQNWSGRGQHAEYTRGEEESIPLIHEKVLGHCAYVQVDSVRCRRIRLARKVIRCNYRLKKEEAIQEVKHMQNLWHTHIIRLVGTYLCGFKLAILLYPVAEYSLDMFLEGFHDGIEIEPRSSKHVLMRNSIRSFFGCLATALTYLHANLIKHMDIKPKNILVKDMGSAGTLTYMRYKIILADFGIAHSYATELEADTESPTSFTRAYAAPELVEQSKRGLSVDVFSLGCVYLEILSALMDSFTIDLSAQMAKVPWEMVCTTRISTPCKSGFYKLLILSIRLRERTWRNFIIQNRSQNSGHSPSKCSRGTLPCGLRQPEFANSSITLISCTRAVAILSPLLLKRSAIESIRNAFYFTIGTYSQDADLALDVETARTIADLPSTPMFSVFGMSALVIATGWLYVALTLPLAVFRVDIWSIWQHFPSLTRWVCMARGKALLRG
ncbi:kinase-like protein [Lophium mytilinum]|uniref:non-specific serine/threonine protein kinase n=1 Tax=Lophium mytilinum TaxID=390894 RepID=A0A6A6QPP8_9PEZI|nr:kinase-like protein [Lophium mytilinum]